MVTMSPNHWCAISWATTSATFFLRADGGGLLVDQEVGLAVGDAAEVLHGAGLEVGEGDHVELGHGILDAEVGVVIVQDVLRLTSTAKLGELDLVGRGAGADGDAVAAAFGALEVADEEGHEIGGHLRRGGELDGVLVGGAGRVGDDVGVGDDGVARVDDEA